MKEVRVPLLTVNYAESKTRVQIEVWEHKGVFSEVWKKFEITFSGVYNDADDELLELVYDAMEKEGIDLS